MIQLQPADTPSCLRAYDRFDYFEMVPPGIAEQMFQLPEGGSVSIDGWTFDVVLQRIGFTTGGIFSWVIGTKGVAGDRDGPGAQALLGMGGGAYGNSLSAASDASGALYWTDSKNDKIKKAVNDGQWTVSTFISGVRSSSIAFDQSGDLWVIVEYGPLQKYDSKGTLLAQFPLPLFGGIAQLWDPMVADKASGLWSTVREAYCSTLWRIDTSNGNVTRIAGLTTAERQAIIDAGQTPPVDGPLLNCVFHTANITYVSDDGKTLVLGGGDETQARKVDIAANQVTSLCTDGVWRELQDIRGGYYIGTPIGLDPDGLPYSMVYPWVLSGTRTWLRKLVPVTVPDPAAFNSASFTSQNIPLQMTAGATVALEVQMTNNGTTTWTEANQYHVGAQLPVQDSPLFGGRLYLGAGVSVAPGQIGIFQGTIQAPAAGVYQVQWQCVQDGVQWFGDKTPAVTVTVQQGGTIMTKSVVLDWSGAQTQNEAVANAQTADHFVVTLDAGAPVAVPGGLTARTFTFLNVPSGTHAVSVACADAAGNLLAPAVMGSAVVPNDPTAPIPVAITVTLA